MKHTITTTFGLAVLAGIFLVSPAFAVVSMSWTSIGDVGNAPDSSTGYGAVDHAYNIGTYEVSGIFSSTSLLGGTEFGISTPFSMTATFEEGSPYGSGTGYFAATSFSFDIGGDIYTGLPGLPGSPDLLVGFESYGSSVNAVGFSDANSNIVYSFLVQPRQPLTLLIPQLQCFRTSR